MTTRMLGSRELKLGQVTGRSSYWWFEFLF